MKEEEEGDVMKGGTLSEPQGPVPSVLIQRQDKFSTTGPW